jgi:hypothetical protein
VGILLFEMLTGQKPFDGELHEIIRHHLSTPAPKIWERRAELSGREDLQRLIDGCMAKLREQRFDSALDLVRTIDVMMPRSSLPPPPLPSQKAVAPDASAGAGSLPEEQPEEDAAGLRGALLTIGLGYQRLGLALLRWLRHAVLPWLKQGAQRAAAAAQNVSSRSGQAARERWESVKPRVAQAQEQLVKAAHEAKERIRPSQRPPAAAPDNMFASAQAEADAADAASSADSSTAATVIGGSPVEFRPKNPPPEAPAKARPAPSSEDKSSQSIAEAATMELDAYQGKHGDLTDRTIEDPIKR